MRAHALGYSGIGVTDEASVSGAVRAHLTSQTLGIPLVHGSRFRVDEQLELTLFAPTGCRVFVMRDGPEQHQRQMPRRLHQFLSNPEREHASQILQGVMRLLRK